MAGLAQRLLAGAPRGVGDGARRAALVLDSSGVQSEVATAPRSDFDSCSAAAASRRRRRRRRRAMVAGLALGLSAGAHRGVGVGARAALALDSSGVSSEGAAVPRLDFDSCSAAASLRDRRRRRRWAVVAGMVSGLSAGAQRAAGVVTRGAGLMPDSSGVPAGFPAASPSLSTSFPAGAGSRWFGGGGAAGVALPAGWSVSSVGALGSCGSAGGGSPASAVAAT